MDTVYLVLIGIVVLYLFLYYVPIGHWMHAKVSFVEISLLELVLMKFRKVPPAVIVYALIELNKADLIINRVDIEELFLSGGNVDNVVQGLIKAKQNNFSLTFKDACQIDKKGYNVTEVVEKELNRK